MKTRVSLRYFVTDCSGLSTFFIKGNPSFNNGSKCLPKSPPDCHVLCNLVFDKFRLADEPFGKVLESPETCALVNNNLCQKLFSSLESLK